MRASAYQYKADNWNRDGQKISFVGRDVDSATANGWFLDAGLFEQDNHTLLTLDGSYRTQFFDKTALEVFANRDWVETRPALNAGTNFTFVGAALDQGLGEHVTVVGVAGTQFFLPRYGAHFGSRIPFATFSIVSESPYSATKNEAS